VIDVVLALVLLADPAAPLPTRAEAAASSACPRGTERVGAPPPEGYETWCERPDVPPPRREGPARTWYDDGGLAKASEWKGGKLDGPYLEWHRNGKLARAGSYRADEREGTWTLWSESGAKEEEATYARNELHGPFGTWWPNGRRRVEGRHCRGLQCGKWITWDEQGHELGKMTYEEIRGTP
jgi:hypothetical protein